MKDIIKKILLIGEEKKKSDVVLTKEEIEKINADRDEQLQKYKTIIEK